MVCPLKNPRLKIVFKSIDDPGLISSPKLTSLDLLDLDHVGGGGGLDRQPGGDNDEVSALKPEDFPGILGGGLEQVGLSFQVWQVVGMYAPDQTQPFDGLSAGC